MANEDADEYANEGREELTISEAAQRMGISVASARRRFGWGEIEGYWTNPEAGRQDVNGHKLRGHRVVYADSVAAWIKRQKTIRQRARRLGNAGAPPPSDQS